MPGERVLVVEDNDAFRSLMATHLQRRGYAVESARDGLDALQVLRGQAQFAVMVTDLMMAQYERAGTHPRGPQV